MKQGNFFLEYKNQNWDFNYVSIPIEELYRNLKTDVRGLSENEASTRFDIYGANEVQAKLNKVFVFDFLQRFANPFIILLLIIASFSFFFGDKLSTLIVSLMVLMSVTLSFFQERRAEGAARKLGEIVQTMCTVVREGVAKEKPLRSIVPGDIVTLSAGDIIPGDVRIITSNDLFIDQSSLTGESFPVEKVAGEPPGASTESLQLRNTAFMGSSVVSGIGTGVVVHTGRHTAFGKVAQKLLAMKSQTIFDTQTKDFTWIMIRMIVLVVLVLMGVYTFQHRDILRSFLFALAVAVQITPETLPMILTINLSKGALVMSRKKTIVKRLNSIQNLGAMDILCSDKTGTLTRNKIVLQSHINIWGEKDESVFMYGYINSFYQTGLKNLLRDAVLEHQRKDLHTYKKVDEIPFDFERKINSVIVKNNEETMISVGAPEEIMKRCSSYEDRGTIKPLAISEHQHILEQYFLLSTEGYRVLAVAYKNIEERSSHYTTIDEQNLIFKGYMAFLDPPKSTAKKAIEELRVMGVAFKIVTGDNELVTKKICADLSIAVEGVALGSQIDSISDVELSELAEITTVFARVTPEQKERIIRCLRLKGHTVGYLGDGINDALSLRAADIGISVNNAVGVAKESAGIVLLEKDLRALADSVWEGRKVFGNFMKYIRMTSMVNVSYMISTIGASFLLPFLPMSPVQILLNNYMYEVGQTAIPSDNVDNEYSQKPRKWNISFIIKFMTFLGPLSSMFDFIMFGILWWIFHAYTNENMFQTGWFIQTMLAQILVIFVIRTRKIPFIQSKPSKFLFVVSAVLLGIVFMLPFTPLARPLSLVKMKWNFYPIVVVVVLTYLAIVWFAKNWFINKVETD